MKKVKCQCANEVSAAAHVPGSYQRLLNSCKHAVISHVEELSRHGHMAATAWLTCRGRIRS
jgi:hypothetical protein